MATLDFGPIDYTSRDYAALRQDVIDAVKARLPDWNGDTDPNDFLRVLLEAFAFVGDLNSYYIDRVANEAFLTTATRRQSLINIARTFGYSPSGPISASLTLSLTNSGTSDVLVPAGTQFKGTYNRDGLPVSVTYETADDVTVPHGGNVTAIASEGETQRGSTLLQSNGEQIGVLLYRPDGKAYSDGTPDQQFVLPRSPVVEDSIQVWIHAPTGTDAVSDGIRYTYYTHLIDASPDDRAFTIIRDADDTVTVQFGDGAGGYVPPAGYLVRAVYRVGAGPKGNVPAGTITIPGLTPAGTSLPATISVNNPLPGLGGIDSESNDAIRSKAYSVLRSRDRAVSLKDFIDIALRSGGVAKANAIGSSLSNIIMYVAPYTEGNDNQPGYTEIQCLVTNVAVSAGLATITTDVAHGMVPGSVVNLSGIGSPFDGTWQIATVPSPTTAVFVMPWADTSIPAAGKLVAVGSETNTFADLRAYAQEQMMNAAPAGIGVSVVGPVYTDITVKVTVQLDSSVRQSVVRRAVQQAVLAAFDVSGADFARQIYTSDVVKAAAAAPGVNSVRVTTFNRGLDQSIGAAAYLSGTPTTAYEVAQDVISGNPYEIFRLLDQNLTVTVLGGIPDAA